MGAAALISGETTVEDALALDELQNGELPKIVSSDPANEGTGWQFNLAEVIGNLIDGVVDMDTPDLLESGAKWVFNKIGFAPELQQKILSTIGLENEGPEIAAAEPVKQDAGLTM